jgi:protein-S-isoprenylcysteine O-methyltransferase Ste14
MTFPAMTLPAWIAAIALFLHLPIPLYWFVLHPWKKFWTRRGNAPYFTGLFIAWPLVTAALIYFHRQLFRTSYPPSWRFVLASAMIVFELWMFHRVRRDLGGARLIGATEISGGGEIARTGIYARIRHPRYAGSFLVIAAACLLAATRALWIVAAVWTLLMATAIAMEEHEMRARFGSAYDEYRRDVPRFVPRLF